ncbi:MAG: hypothetical protein PVJ66_07880 [Gammaproteobacteria bacterium]|jgi:hypothetical protein
MSGEQKNPSSAAGDGVKPGSGTPQQLLERTDLTREQKIEMLQQWELDLRERMVADDENMSSAEPGEVALEDVLEALDILGGRPGSHPVPTTHG